jgi:UrcA family protein
MNRSKYFASLIAMLGLAACSGAPALVRAEGRSQALDSIAVSARDLDLSAPEGVAKLYGRVEAAANSLCARLDGALLAQHLSYRRCYTETLDRAVAREPLLAAYRARKAALREAAAR